MADALSFLFFLSIVLFRFNPVVLEDSDRTKYEPIAQADSALPNIILLLVDDLKFSDLGCYGNTTMKTTNIDRLAREGVLFSRWYAQVTGTATRASILTGLLPIRTGMIRSKFLSFESFPSLASTGGLHPGESDPGYLAQIVGVSHSTAYIGNWDFGIGRDQIYLPMKHGFDFWYGVPAVHTRKCMHTHLPQETATLLAFLPHALWFLIIILLIVGLWFTGRFHLRIAFALKGLVLTVFYFAYLSSHASDFVRSRSCALFRNGQIIEQPYSVENMTLRFTREAGNFINSNRKKPFLLVLSYLHLHAPTFRSQPFARGGNEFLEAIEELDWSVGKILSFLQECNIENHTIIALTADNGMPNQKIGKIISNLRQRDFLEAPTESPKEIVHKKVKGRKRGLWESWLRVPAIIQWKGHVQGGQIVHSAVTSMDLLPTMLEAIGQKGSNTKSDGKSILPLLLKKTDGSPHDFIFHYTDVTKPAAVTFGWFKMIYSTQTDSDQTVLHDPPLLFDIEADPDETTPLSIEDFPQVFANVSQAVEEHLSNRTNKWTSQFDKAILPFLFPCANMPSCYQENKDQENYSDWFPDIRFHSSSVQYMRMLEHKTEGNTKIVTTNQDSNKLQAHRHCTKMTFLKLIQRLVAKRQIYCDNSFQKRLKK